MMSSIDIHADDYALSVRTSREMLQLMKEGVLDSISVITNMSCYGECMDMLKENIPRLPHLPLISVHLNLVEGKSLADDKKDRMSTGWMHLFIGSFIPFYRRSLKDRLRREIEAQMEKCLDDIQECISLAKDNDIPCDQTSIRIDSHQHTHMIPVVRDALMECILQKGYEVGYIRNSKEPLSPFISEPSLWKTYRFVNILKNRILGILSLRMDMICKRAGYRPMYMWGLVMSGRMDEERTGKLFRRMYACSVKKDRDLEILFHPGRMDEGERNDEVDETALISFYLTSDRDAEKRGAAAAASLKRLRDHKIE